GRLFELRHQLAIRLLGGLGGENPDFVGVHHSCEDQKAGSAKRRGGNRFSHRGRPPLPLVEFIRSPRAPSGGPRCALIVAGLIAAPFSAACAPGPSPPPPPLP